MKNKKYIVAISLGVGAIIIIGVTAGLLLRDKSTTSSGNHTTLYTVTSPLMGGRCGYISFTQNGQRSDACIDEASAEKAVAKLKTDDPSLDLSSNEMLMKIEADTHTTTESRSGSTPKPDYQNVQIIVIDKLYNVSLSNVKYN